MLWQPMEGTPKYKKLHAHSNDTTKQPLPLQLIQHPHQHEQLSSAHGS